MNSNASNYLGFYAKQLEKFACCGLNNPHADI